ncbi:TIR domain-containing protein [Clostridium estertheticum]|uniref:TIR domain-containing protein n=1 Tax=Clostridium estertheticum TaxID=238834 RepID=A0AA47EG28_9CLOT|nr:TIR domain-containing protein [Clostridium estertheticum]MBU3157795.1 TIR domain-containing protein [Clostridium estertheticum]WAG59430.1 TIR domain-containing protein [Clostridium estertheticum]
MAKRQVFFSFEYLKDNWRAGQVRSMGKVDSSSTCSDNDWEEVKEKSDKAIKEWIDAQLKMRSCLVVLVGATTSGRKWIDYEINKAYELGKGIVGINIYNLKNKDGKQTTKGSNPFYNILIGSNNERLSKYVTCYESIHTSSQYVYDDINGNMEQLIQDAIDNKDSY